MELEPASLALEIVEIDQLPIYNQDGDASPPEQWSERIRAADAFLFVTPEHNRSVPAALKNAIDVASRPYGQSAWNGKPGAVVSASPSAIGGSGADHHLSGDIYRRNRQAVRCCRTAHKQIDSSIFARFHVEVCRLDRN
ncbi:MAG TPA: NAD(P)H-dependent oxidoreductase [Pseudolabrys sp.]